MKKVGASSMSVGSLKNAMAHVIHLTGYFRPVKGATPETITRLLETKGPIGFTLDFITPLADLRDCKEVLDIVTNPHDLHRMMWLRHQKTVANVKFNVAKLLQSLIPIVDQSVVEKTIRQCLVDLSENPDVDVRYFANQAICSIDDAAAVQS
ncbi:unnamed protein product [Brassica napus]|uniref:(rape) hypothetical protein n=1 Tax=Brassica napus TaxID=3708 RepID=A0A816HXZ0_BRANA|nr:unnamed protein product [Brassica napus]